MLCVFINSATTCAIALFVIFARGEGDTVLLFGPSENLIVLSITVRTWPIYISLILISCLLKVVEVGVNDIGSPDLGFSVYDPSIKKVYGYTRLQLQLLTNSMWLFNNVSNIFKTVVLVSRLDVALISTLAGELTAVFTIAYLLGKKEFYPDVDDEDEKMNAKEKLLVNSQIECVNDRL